MLSFDICLLMVVGGESGGASTIRACLRMVYEQCMVQMIVLSRKGRGSM